MSLLARRGSLFTPDAGGSFTAPVPLAAGTTSWGSGSSAMTLDPPGGVAGGHYQLIAITLASSSPTFGTAPAGWSKITDVTVTFNDSATSARCGLFESTSDTGVFTLSQVGSGRAWRGARMGWSGHGGRTLDPVVITTGVTATPATPVVTTSDPNSMVIGVGFAEEPNGGTGWGFTGTGDFATRVNATAENYIESVCNVIADRVLAAPTSNVTTNFALTNASEAVMVSLVLRGLAA